MPGQRFCSRFLLIIALVANAACALGRDVFVTVGGGPEPESNQVSLEKNVEFVIRTLVNRYPKPLDHRVLFADGSAPDPDLQFQDEHVAVTPAMRWMTRLIGEEHQIPLRYRNHHPFGDNEPADKQHLHELMQSLASELSDGDRLVVYVTAHGSSATFDDDDDRDETSSSTSKHSRDTSILLWGGDELRVSEFTDWLDQFKPEVEVVVVMVPCYSGGFAEIVFRESNRKFGISDRPRCGFFSQRHDRAAAGCTPAIDESDYQEYSSYFFAALTGLSRDGSTVIRADYDNDHRVTLTEAHAYAIIASDTVDVPIKTSDVVLRMASRVATDDDARESSGVVASIFGSILGRNQSASSGGERYTTSRSIDDLLVIAKPDQLAIISSLATQLEVATTSTAKSLQQKRRRMVDRINTLYTKIAEFSDSEDTLVDEIRHSIHRANPEFSEQGFSPIITQWTTTRSDEFVGLVESLEESRALDHVSEKLQTLAAALDRLERREAKLNRLTHTLESVLLEANLTNVADAETIERYKRLVRLENSTLWP